MIVDIFMPLAAGTRLGPCEILCPLGAGGMGEVCRAKGIRLDRTVPIKNLPKSVSGRADLRGLFECEARAVSSLNHPYIRTRHDIGSKNSIDFLAMEYLKGETLAHLFTKEAMLTRSDTE